MPNKTKVYTMEEASQHTSKEDCWIVVDGKVYDVSSYMDDHPGGYDVILEATGKDAADEFKEAGHSKSGRELLETFCIGKLHPSKKVKDLTNLYWAVPVAVSVSAVVCFLFLKKK